MVVCNVIINHFDFVLLTACEAGYYGDGSTCTKCEIGTYTNQTNSDSSCTNCTTEGSTTSATGSTSCDGNNALNIF